MYKCMIPSLIPRLHFRAARKMQSGNKTRYYALLNTAGMIRECNKNLLKMKFAVVITSVHSAKNVWFTVCVCDCMSCV